VDIEFAANFIRPEEYRINLLQCRPLQVQGTGAMDVPAVEVPEADVLLAARGAVVGMGRVAAIDRVVYVAPELYGTLPDRDRHAIARAIGEINRACGRRGGATLLVGPGRWGTGTPSLGVPVNFSEINHVAALCELATMHATLTPDVSLGTHFFNELVEMNVLYFALFPEREGNRLDAAALLRAPNRLADYAPASAKWADGIRVVELETPLRLVADPRHQRVVCYRAG
jgi:hypothetical protein